ncbi:unnamed protein product [Clonostachys chloroleuca]|uniref:Uncharacterized protein n=1 Tax=Clonostachys chloroleuca TaxID=1926264 RepID=A0AA35LSG4_9HYPO|nr:unnamed protein product [Clonostachys chloroleuca]
MASLPRSGPIPDTPNPVAKQIPLLCSVCPETPNFSDVSHLLTHIASKGHLHHETQTKLKAHQDLVSSIALQQYEQWYRENNIERLLVDRMKAKQVKEAARNKRNRASSATSIPKGNRKQPRRSTSNNTVIKTEEGLVPDFPGLAGFFASDNEIEAPEELAALGDMISMKGQVWPGMGKMDLATEEMKRTRNQRKPKSVVEKMRRTSEEIEPTQVVMTSQFNVERIKGVYDDDSPVSDQDVASPPRRITRKRRKETQPLAEISSNIPRGSSSRTSRPNGTEKPAKLEPLLNNESIVDMPSAIGAPRSQTDIFHDENRIAIGSNEVYPSSSTQRDSRFDLRGRAGLQSMLQNSHSGLSPHTSTRDLHTTVGSQRTSSQVRLSMHPYLTNGSQFTLGSFSHQDPSYTLGDSSLYQTPSQLSYMPGLHYDLLGQDSHTFSSSHHQTVPKSEDFSQNDTDDPLGSSVANVFLNFGSGNSNALFGNDRLFFNSYTPPATNPPFTSIGHNAATIDREVGYSTSTEELLQTSATSPVKIEPQPNGLLEHDNSGLPEANETIFDPKNVWRLHDPENTLDIPDALRSEGLDL